VIIMRGGGIECALYYANGKLVTQAPRSDCSRKLVDGIASVLERSSIGGADSPSTRRVANDAGEASAQYPEIISFLGPGGYFIAALTFCERVRTAREYGSADARAQLGEDLDRIRLPRSQRLLDTLRGERWAKQCRTTEERCANLGARHFEHNLAETALLVRLLGRLKGSDHAATLRAHEELLVLEIIAKRWVAVRERLRMLTAAYDAQRGGGSSALELQWAITAFDLAVLLCEGDIVETAEGGGGGEAALAAAARAAEAEAEANGNAELWIPEEGPGAAADVATLLTSVVSVSAAARAAIRERRTEAAQLFEGVLAVLQKHRGGSDPSTRLVMRRLACVLWELATLGGVTGTAAAPHTNLRLLLTKAHRTALRQRKKAEELCITLKQSSATPKVFTTCAVPKALCLVARRQKPGFMCGALAVLLRTLTACDSSSGDGSGDGAMLSPDSWIATLLASAEPVPGRYVRITAGSTALFDVCRPTTALPGVCDIGVHTLFTRLAPESVAQLVACALLGKHIALTSRDRSALCHCVAGLHALLRPIVHDGHVVHLLPAARGDFAAKRRLWRSIKESHVAMLVGVALFPEEDDADDACDVLVGVSEARGAIETAVDASFAVAHLDSNAVDVPPDFAALPIVCRARLLRTLRATLPRALAARRGECGRSRQEWDIDFGPGAIAIRFECRLRSCRFWERSRVTSQQFIADDMEKPAYLVVVAFDRRCAPFGAARAAETTQAAAPTNAPAPADAPPTAPTDDARTNSGDALNDRAEQLLRVTDTSQSCRLWPLARDGIVRLEAEFRASTRGGGNLGEVSLVHAGGYGPRTVAACMAFIECANERHASSAMEGPMTMRFRSPAVPPPFDDEKSLRAELKATAAALLAKTHGGGSRYALAARESALGALERELAAMLAVKPRSDGSDDGTAAARVGAAPSMRWVDDAVAACVDASATMLRHAHRCTVWPSDAGALKRARRDAAADAAAAERPSEWSALPLPALLPPTPPIRCTLEPSRAVQRHAMDESRFVARLVQTRRFATYARIRNECEYDVASARRRFGSDAVSAVMACDTVVQHVALVPGGAVCPIAALGDDVVGSCDVALGDVLDRRRHAMRNAGNVPGLEAGRAEARSSGGLRSAAGHGALSGEWMDSDARLATLRRRFKDPPSIAWTLKRCDGGTRSAKRLPLWRAETAPHPSGNCVWSAFGARPAWRDEDV
jgi:hypothetical protein